MLLWQRADPNKNLSDEMQMVILLLAGRNQLGPIEIIMFREGPPTYKLCENLKLHTAK